MKYRLCEQYSLRGYEDGAEQVVYDLKTRQRYSISDGMSAVLKLCDGKTDINNFSTIPIIMRLVEKAVQKGWVVADESGRPLSPEQCYRVSRLPNMMDFQWSITGKCNARCRHCFVNASQSQHQDLTTDEMLGIIEKIGEGDITSVCLTGGEPLCRQDLPILLEAMHDRNIHVTRVCTNGFLLTDGILDVFEKYGRLPGFQISFDGVGCHDWMRGITGAEEKTVRAMEVCRKHGAPVILMMCVHAGNIGSIPDTVRLAVSKGVKYMRIAFTDDIGGFSKNNGIELLSMDQAAKAYLEYLPVFCRERPDINLEILRFVKINGNEPEKYSIIPEQHSCTDFKGNRFCSIVRHSFYVSDEGRVLPCMTLAGTEIEQRCLKLTEHSLEECITSPAHEEFLHSDASLLLKENPECARCEHLTKCGCGCRGDAIGGHQGMFGIEKKRCDFFKHGWGQRIRQVMDECLRTAESEEHAR